MHYMVFTISFSNSFLKTSLTGLNIHIKTKMIVNDNQQCICHQLLVFCRAATLLKEVEQQFKKLYLYYCFILVDMPTFCLLPLKAKIERHDSTEAHA